MKEFTSFDSFAKHMNKVVSQYNEREYKSLNFLGSILEEEAKNKIGHLQKGGGQFDDWKPLAESTKADKERLGYVFNDEYNPLYRTGELKNSIGHVVNRVAHTLYVGSSSEIAVYHEFGTKHIPERSFLGLTFFKAKYEIQHVLASFLLNWITNNNSPLKRPAHGSL